MRTIASSLTVRSFVLDCHAVPYIPFGYIYCCCGWHLQELDSLLSSTFQFNRLRGCSVAFGYLAVRRFLDKNELMCVIRAHAVQEDGYYRHFEKALKRRDVGKRSLACKRVASFPACRLALLGMNAISIEPSSPSD